MDACSIEMKFEEGKTKTTFGASKEDDRILLSKLAHDGLVRRYKKNNKPAKERIEKELKIINDLGFNAYFLINNDIVNYARSRGFYHVGRGSSANSIVAYCLGIPYLQDRPLGLRIISKWAGENNDHNFIRNMKGNYPSWIQTFTTVSK
ncbi:MAG TPA: hypothetical protein VNT20_17290 [Flavisolibacter sp.]|jgi:DNA polymerase-3 subunit alpha|nr:hypothetical protein [Flavisolibacter sp.]